MGVPAFFRWLSRKYPSVIIECIENKKEADNGTFVYEDATLPNPNGVEFDNLYLDMNGIIHPCTHPEDKPPPKDENEMMEAIFDCIDRLFAIVRPRKILYLAIDGVAPRAKMNQQRSRRFRASKETSEKASELQKIREDLVQRGCTLPPQCVKGSTFDSNCITPGTPFMDKLSKCLQYYIHDRMNNNVAWKNIKVILSDANVPGEGEHKIMDFIRKQRGQPTHDPNTQHVLCGADADLIMLGLATHEPNFTIIREEFLPNKPRPCEICNLFGHEAKECSGIDSFGTVDSTKLDVKIKETNFIFVRLSVLKEYLERELEMPNLPFPYEFERVLDDWVFMCFFVGNDFLPHLPSLEIREGAIDRLVNLYKKCVYKTGGYLTDSGMVALERVEMIMTDLGYMEDNIFKERQRNEIRFRENAKRRKLQETMKKPDYKVFLNTQFDATPLGSNVNPSQLTNARQEISILRKTDTQTGNDMTQKRKLEAKEGTEQNDEDDEPNDEVRLWELGFKDRYYQSKFDVEPENLQFRNTVALEYVRGLCWVLKYYYQGCASWSWYFPYHYAPFASDFLNITGLNTKFDKGKPFDPLEQLMGVFPAASKIHVPEIFSQLMEDPMSLIIDFYPEDFKIDLNGKKFAWQGVALLPFVDEKRLFKALQPLREKLNQAEQNRNETGNDKLFLRHNSCIHKDIIQVYNSSSVKNEIPIVLDGMSGTIGKCKENIPINASLVSPLDCHMELTSNQVITVSFNNPLYDDDHIFEAKQLKNAINPKRVLHSGLQQHSSYRQSMGFSGNSNQEHTLSLAGRRMINNYLPEQYQQRSQQNRYSQQQRNPLMRGNQSRHGYNEERSVHNNEYGPAFRHYGNTNGSRGHQRQNNPYHRYAPYDYHK